MKQDFKPEDLPKKNIYPVPDGYFEKLPTIIMARVTDHANAPVRTWFMGLYEPYRVALASSTLALSFVGVFWLAQNQPADEAFNAAVILPTTSHQEVIDYISSTETLDNRDLAELTLTDTDLSTEFIKVNSDDILQLLDGQPLEEVYFN